MPNKQESMLNNPWIAATCAAALERLTLHPIDTTISIQQARRLGLLPAINWIQQTYGLSGFYRGQSIPLVLATMGFNISLYGSYKQLRKNGANPIQSAISSGIFASVIYCPAETKRIREVFGIGTRSMHRHYRGFGIFSIKCMVFSMIAVAGAEEMASQLPKSPSSHFASGFFMGVVAQTVTTPLDVIKNEIMSDTSPKPYSSYIRGLSFKDAFNSLFTRQMRYGLASALLYGTVNILSR